MDGYLHYVKTLRSQINGASLSLSKIPYYLVIDSNIYIYIYIYIYLWYIWLEWRRRWGSSCQNLSWRANAHHRHSHTRNRPCLRFSLLSVYRVSDCDFGSSELFGYFSWIVFLNSEIKYLDFVTLSVKFPCVYISARCNSHLFSRHCVVLLVLYLIFWKKDGECSKYRLDCVKDFYFNT